MLFVEGRKINTAKELEAEFKAFGLPEDEYSYEACTVLFDLHNHTKNEIELDVPIICFLWDEKTIEEIRQDLGADAELTNKEVLETLNYSKIYFETTPGSVLYPRFDKLRQKLYNSL